MQPHPRIRKTIKWGGLALTVLLVVVWIGSSFHWLKWSGASTDCQLGYGVLILLHRRTSPLPYEGWTYGKTPGLSASMWWFGGSRDATAAICYLPLWCPALVLGSMTASAWRLDALARRARRALPLCPTCRYDRTGLASPGGVCPECGSPPPSPRSAA